MFIAEQLYNSFYYVSSGVSQLIEYAFRSSPTTSATSLRKVVLTSLVADKMISAETKALIPANIDFSTSTPADLIFEIDTAVKSCKNFKVRQDGGYTWVYYTPNTQENGPDFTRLPPELIMLIFNELADRDIYNISLVSKSCHLLTQDERLFKFFLKKTYPHLSISQEGALTTWKNARQHTIVFTATPSVQHPPYTAKNRRFTLASGVELSIVNGDLFRSTSQGQPELIHHVGATAAFAPIRLFNGMTVLFYQDNGTEQSLVLDQEGNINKNFLACGCHYDAERQIGIIWYRISAYVFKNGTNLSEIQTEITTANDIKEASFHPDNSIHFISVDNKTTTYTPKGKALLPISSEK